MLCTSQHRHQNHILFNPCSSEDRDRYFCKQCRSRWAVSSWAVSSGSTLFAILFLVTCYNCYPFGNNGWVQIQRRKSLFQTLMVERVKFWLQSIYLMKPKDHRWYSNFQNDDFFPEFMKWTFSPLILDMSIVANQSMSIKEQNGKQFRSWWYGSLWAVSTETSLFAQVFSLVRRVRRVERGLPRWLSWMRRPTGHQEVAGSTPAEVGNILSWILIMKYFVRSFSPFRWFKTGSCQFLVKECAQYWLTA